MPRVACDARILKWLLNFLKIDAHLNERLFFFFTESSLMKIRNLELPRPSWMNLYVWIPTFTLHLRTGLEWSRSCTEAQTITCNTTVRLNWYLMETGGWSGRGMKLTIFLRLVSWVRMSGAILPLPLMLSLYLHGQPYVSFTFDYIPRNCKAHGNNRKDYNIV